MPILPPHQPPRQRRALAAILALGLLIGLPAGLRASPWAEVGDAPLRRDIEILAGYGLIDGLVTTWPIPWAQVSRALAVTDASAYPPHVQQALRRVSARFRAETGTQQVRYGAEAKATNEPPLVRGFGDDVYDEVSAAASAEYMWDTTAGRLTVGYLGQFDFEDARVVLSGSYLAQELGNWLIYGGLLDQWWGPGHVSSLILSNNARPFPYVGVMRNDPRPFETPWLSWIGPWQLSAFGGILDDDRQIDNVAIFGARLAVSPLQGLEIGASQTIQFCGEDRPCGAETFGRALIWDEGGEQLANHLAGFDIRYTVPVGAVLLSGYGQYIGEDQRSNLPNKASWILGGSMTGYTDMLDSTWQVIAEASNTFGKLRSTADVNRNRFYNGAYSPDGYRYHERALGHSLDNDSRLYSVVVSLTDRGDRYWYAAYHRAELNQDDEAGFNAVSATAEDVNLGTVGVRLPWGQSLLSLQLLLQDDQPDTPDEKDWLFSAVAGWSLRF